MKQLIIILLLITFSILSKGQDVPFDLDSMINSNVDYEIIKLTENDSFPNSRFYEGGVLMIPKEKSYLYDTIYVKDIKGIEKHKLNSFTTQHFFKGYVDKRILAFPSLERCKIKEEIFCIRDEVMPRMWPTFIDYEIKEEYKNEYPNGLPEEMVIYSFKYDEPQLLSWEEYKLIAKHKTNRRLFGEFISEDNEGNIYYPIPSGYYSSWTDLDCNKITTIKIQKALKERGYNVEVTGVFDSKTKAAFTQFQKENGLGVSCFGGPNDTLRALGIYE